MILHHLLLNSQAKQPEFMSPPPNDNKRLGTVHDVTPLRYRGIDNVIGRAPVPGQAARELVDDTLYLASEGEPSSFAEVERELAWRAARKEEIDALDQNIPGSLWTYHTAITLLACVRYSN